MGGRIIYEDVDEEDLYGVERIGEFENCWEGDEWKGGDCGGELEG